MSKLYTFLKAYKVDGNVPDLPKLFPLIGVW